jgi:Dickkopf N-terminal cysteine-rich region
VGQSGVLVNGDFMLSIINRFVAVALVPALACEVTVEAVEPAPPIEIRAAAAASPLLVELSQDPVYLALLADSTQRAAVMLDRMIVPAWEEHGADGPERVFHRWADYRHALTSLGIDPDEVSDADAPALTEVTGVTLAQIATTMERIEYLDERYGFLALTHAQHAVAVDLAMSNANLQSLANDTWGDEAVLQELGADTLDPCVLECVEAAADTWLILSSAVYAAAELFEAFDVDVIFIAVEGAVLAVTASTFQNCVDECGAEIEVECHEDSECEPKEYCDRGWLTIGRNQCVFSRDEDDICTRDEQCETGCCKYYAWSNLVSPVCRPANKCD